MPDAIQVASLFATADLKDNLTPALGSIDDQLSKFKGKVAGFTSPLKDFGENLGMLVAPLAAIGAVGIQTAATFESSMLELSARTGLVGESLNEVKNFALQMGADTAFSSQQAADGLLNLLSAGLNTSEAMTVLPAVMDMAAASGESLAVSTEGLTSILGAYNLPASQAVEITNALAQGAAVSTVTISDLSQAFGNVAPVANAFGISVEETTAILAKLGNAGIKGAEAGTALKSLLTNMTSEKGTKALKSIGSSMFYTKQQIAEIVKQNKELASAGIDELIPLPKVGDIRPVADVFMDVKQAMDGMSDQRKIAFMQELGGAYGQVALKALTTGKSIDQLLIEMEQQSTASEVAQKKLGGFNGSLETLKGSFETLLINGVAPFLEQVGTPFLNSVTEIINQINEWVKINPELMKNIGLVTIALLGMSAGAIGINFVVNAVTGLAVSFGMLFSRVAFLAPILLLIFGLIGAYETNFGGFRDIVDGLATAFLNLSPALQGFVIVATIASFLLGRQMLLTFFSEIAALLPGLIGSIGFLASGFWALIIPLLTVVALIGGLLFIVWALSSNFMGVSDTMKKLAIIIGIDLVKGLAQAGIGIRGFVDLAIGKFKEFMKSLLGNMAQPLITLFKALALAAGMIGDFGSASKFADVAMQLEGMASGGQEYGQIGKTGGTATETPDEKRSLDAAAGKKSGGNVSSMARVGEGNNPELFQSRGKTYLIPGERGKVMPNFQGTGGGGSVNVGNVVMYGVNDPVEFLDRLEKEANRRNGSVFTKR